MTQKNHQEQTIRAIERAFQPELKYIRIVKGGKEKAREFTHIFVPGPIYGGKMGMLLCRRAWSTFTTYEVGDTRQDVCEQCAEKLRKMAIIIADLFPQDLFGIAGGAIVKPITPEDILTVLKEYNDRQKREKILAETVPMFAANEIEVAVERTQPWLKAFQ